jgi:hypothetical protein
MAVAVTSNRVSTAQGSDLRQLEVQFNALVTLLAAWAATMDADGGITATTFVSTLEAAVSKVGDSNGTAITA